MGRNITRGALDELLGEDRDGPGLTEVEMRLVEQGLARRLGKELGEGALDGATAISPERRAELEATIDALIAVASYRSAKGLRDEVGPEFRHIVRREIVGSFAQGVRGEIGDALDETIERATARAVNTAVDTLHERLQEPALRLSIAELLREVVYEAVEGGSYHSPGIGRTLENTLTHNLLDPFQDSVGGVTDRVAWRISESAKRTENLLKTIISGLIIVLVVLGVLYIVRDRQARRARETTQKAQEGLRTVGAALDQLDDDGLRALRARIHEYDELINAEVTKRKTKPKAKTSPPKPPA